MGSLLFGLAVALRQRGRGELPPATGAYGTARWSTRREFEDAGLLETQGIVLCQTEEARFVQRKRGGWSVKSPGQLVRHDGPERAIVFAPTRSGKGVGVVAPTLLSWPGSVIVYDVKRENWALTAGCVASSRTAYDSSRP